MANKNLFITILLAALLITGCSSLEKTEKTQEIMGTVVTITVYDNDKEKTEHSINSAFKEIQRIEDSLSNTNNKSEVYLLNKQGFIEDPSEDLIVNVEKAYYYSNLTNGAFDITIQPLLDLYKYSFEELKRAPTGDEINDTLELVNYRNIFIKNNLVLFKREGMKITLGGIAKGHAVDKAIEVLEKNGIKHALVNAGGDMEAIGTKGEENWQIALQNPRNKEEYITIIPLDNKAVATSGDYERYFDESKEFHHIVNPGTGYSATELISATIITDNAVDADALATSVFVLGKEKGLELIESLSNVEGLIITKEKEIIKSSGFDY